MAERTGVFSQGDFSKIAETVEVLLRVVDQQLEVCFRRDKTSPWTKDLVPAWVLTDQASPGSAVWGAHALAWSLRGREARMLFPLGYPCEPVLARKFLAHLAEHRLTSLRNPRVVVGLTTSGLLEQEVWQEVFDEGGWQLCGFLELPLYLKTLYGRVLPGVSPTWTPSKNIFLERRMEALSWLALEGDQILAHGAEPGLGTRSLVREFHHHMRHEYSLEVAEPAALEFLFSEHRMTSAQVAGRQLHSGLPSRVLLEVAEYWKLESQAGMLWKELQSQIAFRILGCRAAESWLLLPENNWELVMSETLPWTDWPQDSKGSGLSR